MNRKLFFDHLRGTPLFGGRLVQSQVDALNAILDESGPYGMPIESVAYIMATAYHEPGRDMLPREENLYYRTAARIREVWPTRFPNEAAARPYTRNPRGLAMKVYGAREDLGNVTPEQGWTYRGRGLPMLTGLSNYERAGGNTGLPLVARPDLMLELDIAVRVMVAGMDGGWFTGYSLADARKVKGYIDDRKIINGTDQAALVAGYAVVFAKALAAGGWTAVPTSVPVPPPRPTPAAVPPDWLAAAPDGDAIRRVGAWLAQFPQERPAP